ncbi:MAG: fibronectin-binding protein (FBP), partial [Candidatus Hydrogenedentes bacterium]|nr:fibronectin-binding protein (FBP) [Candidatus Hydrogenedentota bacterium]
MIDWKKHLYKTGPEAWGEDSPPDDPGKHRKGIEPWLSAVFQSEHLSLLLGNGFTSGIAAKAGAASASMMRYDFKTELFEKMNEHAKKSAVRAGRGEEANFEDQIRVANQLLAGLKIIGDSREDAWKKEIEEALLAFLRSILETERNLLNKLQENSQESETSGNILVSFLLSFASRAASRDRLNLFTTNYDRLIEYACDHAGVRVIDRFVGALVPVFRSSRVN